MDLGPHAAFIWLCYGVVAVVVLALIGWLLVQGHRRKQELALLEQKGGGRGVWSGQDGTRNAS